MPTEARAPRLRASILASGLALAGSHASGCTEMPVTPDPPDAFRIPRDVGPVDAYTPPPPDAVFPDAGPAPDAFDPTDAAATRDAGADAGSSTRVVVDGRLTERVWDTATTLSSSEALVGPYAGTVISRLQYVRTGDELALAVAGTFPVAGSVVAVYLDVDYPNVTEGVLLSAAGLGDRTGAVDAVLSNVLMATDATFRPELGWGASRRPEAVTAGNDSVGWRLLDQTGPHVLARGQISACTTDACETTLSLSLLGVPATQALGVVVRVGDPAMPDLWAPLQTIPFDPDPEFVSVVETIPAAE